MRFFCKATASRCGGSRRRTPHRRSAYWSPAAAYATLFGQVGHLKENSRDKDCVLPTTSSHIVAGRVLPVLAARPRAARLGHAKALRIRRYTQGHTFTDTRIAPAVNARGCQVPPYDGVAEVYWETVEDLLDGANSAEGRAAGRALLEDERRFIDLPNSSQFFVREHEIVPA
jgi:EthD domain